MHRTCTHPAAELKSSPDHLEYLTQSEHHANSRRPALLGRNDENRLPTFSTDAIFKTCVLLAASADAEAADTEARLSTHSETRTEAIEAFPKKTRDQRLSKELQSQAGRLPVT